MKKIIPVALSTLMLLEACGTQKTDHVLVGKWLITLSPAKIALIEKVYQENVAEVNKLKTAPDFLVAKYGVSDLDSIKAYELNAFKTEYELAMKPAQSYVWEFTPDGYLLSTDLRQHKTDTVYQYQVAEDQLNMMLLPERDVAEEFGLSDQITLNVVAQSKDSLLLTRTEGPIVDSVYYVRYKNNI